MWQMATQIRYKRAGKETAQTLELQRHSSPVCNNCTPNSNVVPLPAIINTTMSQRDINIDRLQQIQHISIYNVPQSYTA